MEAKTSLDGRNYDIFLSFSGEDTRKNFTNHLYHNLKDGGINVFRDNEGLQRGEQIATQLKQTIQRSRMSIVVLSRNYASSRWCLEELVQIMECKKTVDQMVVPVFYDVDPSDVRHQKGIFAEAFAKHEKCYGGQPYMVASWRAALTEVANLSGYHLNNGFEGELTNKIVKEISNHVHESKELPLLTTELVGEAFGRNKELIWSWLMDDQMFSVGIYGMGGVGKTTLMTHIQNQLLKAWSSSDQYVYWVTVSHDFNIYKLQNLIAKKINLDLSDDEDERERAAKLFKALTEKGRCILILDDLWNHFDLLSVGVPVSNRCKLVLTTRSLDVCRKMNCKENLIKVQPLSEEEAWYLFAKELGSYNIEVEPLARNVARKCSGLPLGIRIMARSMREVDDVREWRNALEELRESKVKQDDVDVELFGALKLSYLRLSDLALQKCFLYCALFPENDEIRRDELIALLIVEGIVNERKSRVAEFDNGHTMLNRLENVCLLEACVDSYNFKCVKMHDVIRDMAIRELRHSSTMTALVEAGLELEELPDVKMWTESLLIVSLMKNNILEIPSSYMPRCFHLSSLLLQNECLHWIANSFFEQFHKLKILDFSKCISIEELPDSIRNLVNLAALFLSGCWNLRHVPSLLKLTELKLLDLSGCPHLKEMPEGVEMLSNLRCLDLNNTSIKEIPKGLLPKLFRLQVLKLFSLRPIRVRGKEVERLRKLETLECAFRHPSDFDLYIKSREPQALSEYHFFIGRFAQGIMS